MSRTTHLYVTDSLVRNSDDTVSSVGNLYVFFFRHSYESFLNSHPDYIHLSSTIARQSILDRLYKQTGILYKYLSTESLIDTYFAYNPEMNGENLVNS